MMKTAQGIVDSRWLAGVVGLMLVVASLVVVPGVAQAQVDPRVPGPGNPVGPTNWNNLVDESSFVSFNSGGNITVENTRFLNGFDVTNGTNVTMRNCHVINPGSFWTVLVRSGSLTMEDCQIGDDTTQPGERGIGGSNVTLRRVKVIGHSDGIKTGDDSLYEQVWVTDLREFRPDDHPDAMQDDGDGGGYVIRYSRLEGWDSTGEPGNAAAIIKSDLGPINDVLFEYNVLDGGNYVLMVDKGNSYPAPTNIVIRNNAFGKNSRWGVLLRDDNADITWENNFWEDTGEFIDENGNVTGPPIDPPIDPPPPGDGPFDDVPQSHTFVDDIIWLADTGITVGCNPPSNSRFCPNDHVTRGQMAAFLARAFDFQGGNGNSSFNDVPSSHNFAEEIVWLANTGITIGCNPPQNTRFCPDNYVTRAQMAAFLARAFDS